MNAKPVSNAVCCLCSVVFLVTCITSSRTEAASYQQTDGTIVGPILDTSGDSHYYSGENLEPNAWLAGANLDSATLTDANLTNANLTNANLTNANLTNANLLWADLTDANLTGVSSGGITGIPNVLPTNWQLTGGYLIGPQANLGNADLRWANLTDTYLGDADLPDGYYTLGIRRSLIVVLPPRANVGRLARAC